MKIFFTTQQKTNTIVCLILSFLHCYFLLITGTEKYILLIFNMLQKVGSPALPVILLLFFLFLPVILVELFKTYFKTK